MVYLNGVYSSRDIFKIRNDLRGLPDKVTVQMSDPTGSTVYQSYEFSTNCAVPLRIGDVFCGLTVSGFYTPQQGGQGGVIGPVDGGTEPNPNLQCLETPKKFIFEFTGDPCASSENNQGEHFFCTLDRPPITYPARITVTSESMDRVFVDMEVQSPGAQIVIGDGVNDIGINKVIVTVTNADKTDT